MRVLWRLTFLILLVVEFAPAQDGPAQQALRGAI